jgi:hypothetical protein
MFVAQALEDINAKWRETALHWVWKEAKIAAMKTAFSSAVGELLVYLPKRRDRQICLFTFPVGLADVDVDYNPSGPIQCANVYCCAASA